MPYFMSRFLRLKLVMIKGSVAKQPILVVTAHFCFRPCACSEKSIVSILKKLGHASEWIRGKYSEETSNGVII